jgi:superfamily II DNA/RNA helicase
MNVYDFLGLLDKYTMNNEHEIIIFTSTAKDAERLAQMLEYYSFTVLLAHEFLWPEQLVEVRRRWNTPHSSDSFLILGMIL